MPIKPKSLRLGEVASKMRDRAVDPDGVPSYRRLLASCLDGRCPSRLLSTNRREVWESDLPEIAEIFGVKLRTDRKAA